MPDTIETIVEPTIGTPAPKPVTVSFGDGRYSSVMRELDGDAQRLLGLSKSHAEKLARAFGAELGRYNAYVKIGFGKATKDGKMTLRESASIKGVTVTHAIALAKACVLLQDSMN